MIIPSPNHVNQHFNTTPFTLCAFLPDMECIAWVLATHHLRMSQQDIPVANPKMGWESEIVWPLLRRVTLAFRSTTKTSGVMGGGGVNNDGKA